MNAIVRSQRCFDRGLYLRASLIAAHRVKWHRRLGAFGATWAALVVIVGSVTTLHAAAREVRGHTDFAASQVAFGESLVS